MALLAAVLLAGGLALAAEPPPLAEHQIKALYLFNFTKYVEWPAETFASADAPFTVGIFGSPEISGDLAEIAKDKKVQGRNLLIRSLEKEKDVKTCQIVFFGAGNKPRWSGLLKAAQEAAVLTVGETGDFLDLGGVINFVRKDNKVRLEISLESAQRARLAVSAKLLAVADVVRGKADLRRN